MSNTEIQNSIEDPLTLLREWFEWWQGTDSVPHKMPNSLHTRTALAIALNDAARHRTLEEEQRMCPHDYWKFEEHGRTSCRACGADTSDMEAMGG